MSLMRTGTWWSANRIPLRRFVPAPRPAAARLWCCSSREKAELPRGGVGGAAGRWVFGAILNLLGQSREGSSSSLWKRHKRLNVRTKRAGLQTFFFSSLGAEVHIFARYSFSKGEDLGLWSHAIRHSGFRHANRSARVCLRKPRTEATRAQTKRVQAYSTS